MNAGDRRIKDIFNGARILEIPFFQRAYVWGEEQWERMLEDMENVSSKNKPYFLGSVILKQHDTSTNGGIGDVRTVIDGQQRLTTLNILFKVFCLKANKDHLFNNAFKILVDDIPPSYEISLRHNHNDIESFNKILELSELEDLEEDNNKIFAAYNHFKKNLKPDKIDFNKILANLLFVVIDLNENEDEQQIFDTINSLGVRLTTAELLKNYFFHRNIDLYDKFWKNIFEKDEETKNYWDREITAGRSKRTIIDLFFFSYLQIKIQEKNLDVKTEDKIEFSKVEQLFESYKKFIKKYLGDDKNSILTEIKDYAFIFRENFDCDIVGKELTNNAGIERINAIIFGLENSTLIPYVLYILKNVGKDSNINDLFEIIETFIMRRMVIRDTTKNYNQFFTDRLINNEILSKNDFVKYLEGQSDKVNSLPSDEQLKNGFNDSHLINKQAKGILYFIESKLRNKEKYSTELKGLDQYSLEHLMPKKWENNWGKLSSQEETNERNHRLLTLGNLAIITQPLNSSIRDADWKTKKEGKGGKKEGLNKYASGLETLSTFLDSEEWNEKEIKNRAKFLFERAKDIWKI